MIILRDTGIKAIALLAEPRPASYHIASFVIETLLIGRRARLFRSDRLFRKRDEAVRWLEQYLPAND